MFKRKNLLTLLLILHAAISGMAYQTFKLEYGDWIALLVVVWFGLGVFLLLRIKQLR